MTPAELTAIKSTLGRSLLLYLSDHCPVGCAHCSVDATADEPPAEPQRIRALCDGINRIAGLEVVGLSGGEPLSDRAALEAAIATLAPRLRLVLHTSGVPWVRGRRPPWLDAVVARLDTVVLSFSSFHARALGRADYADEIIAHLVGRGVDVHLHTLRDSAPDVAAAHAAVARAPTGGGRVFVSPIPFVSAGRGDRLPVTRPLRPIADLGPCRAVAAPAVRGDGHFVACCNETALRHKHDPDLVQVAADADAVVAAFARHAASPMVATLLARGPAALTDAAGAARGCRDLCDGCAMARGRDLIPLTHRRAS